MPEGHKHTLSHCNGFGKRHCPALFLRYKVTTDMNTLHAMKGSFLLKATARPFRESILLKGYQSRINRTKGVACANTNAVWVVDLDARIAKEQILRGPLPRARVGTTPNALALSPDGSTLLVANADNNTVAGWTVEEPGRSEVEVSCPWAGTRRA